MSNTVIPCQLPAYDATFVAKELHPSDPRDVMSMCMTFKIMNSMMHKKDTASKLTYDNNVSISTFTHMLTSQ